MRQLAGGCWRGRGQQHTPARRGSRRCPASFFRTLTCVISTVVEEIALNQGKDDQTWVDAMTSAEAKGNLEEDPHFAAGSMAAKIEAFIGYPETGWRQGHHHRSAEHHAGSGRGDRHPHHRVGEADAEYSLAPRLSQTRDLCRVCR